MGFRRVKTHFSALKSAFFNTIRCGPISGYSGDFKNPENNRHGARIDALKAPFEAIVWTPSALRHAKHVTVQKKTRFRRIFAAFLKKHVKDHGVQL